MPLSITVHENVFIPTHSFCTAVRMTKIASFFDDEALLTQTLYFGRIKKSNDNLPIFHIHRFLWVSPALSPMPVSHDQGLKFQGYLQMNYDAKYEKKRKYTDCTLKVLQTPACQHFFFIFIYFIKWCFTLYTYNISLIRRLHKLDLNSQPSPWREILRSLQRASALSE